jgi:hypothetical protein
MALALVIKRRRFSRTIRNMGRILLSFGTLRVPGQELTIDNRESAKVPFGVAAAIAVLLFAASQDWVVF